MVDGYPDPHAYLILSLQQSVEESAFEVLYDAYSSLLFGVIVRIVADQKEAENLLQDCFVKIWRNIKHYDPEKGRVATWLITIARHTALDFIRSPYFQQKATSQEVHSVTPSAPQLVVGKSKYRYTNLTIS